MCRPYTAPQVNLLKIQEGVQELNIKMSHEKKKLAEFSLVMADVEGRFNEAKEINAALLKDLDAKQEAFKAFERKDLKLREDMKHLGAKKKKIQQKKSKDEEKSQVRGHPGGPFLCLSLPPNFPITIRLLI